MLAKDRVSEGYLLISPNILTPLRIIGYDIFVSRIYILVNTNLFKVGFNQRPPIIIIILISRVIYIYIYIYNIYIMINRVETSEIIAIFRIVR